MSINRHRFLKIIKEYIPNYNQLSIKQISKISHLNYARCYYTLSSKNHTKSISDYNAKQICKGFHIPFAKLIRKKPKIKPKHINHKKNQKFNQSKNNTKKHQDNIKHPVLVFYPSHKYYALPSKIQEIMSTKGISIKDMAKHEFINPIWVHQLFQGKINSVLPVDVVRLAHSLKVPFKDLQKYNHTEIEVKTKPLFQSHQNNVKKNHKEQTNQHINDNIKYIKHHINKLEPIDIDLVAQLIKRLIKVQY